MKKLKLKNAKKGKYTFFKKKRTKKKSKTN